jgi:hypothetical protein
MENSDEIESGCGMENGLWMDKQLMICTVRTGAQCVRPKLPYYDASPSKHKISRSKAPKDSKLRI